MEVKSGHVNEFGELGPNHGKRGEGVKPLEKAEYLKISDGELDGVVLVDEVEDGALDCDEGLLNRLMGTRLGTTSSSFIVVGEKVLQVFHVDGGVEGERLEMVDGRSSFLNWVDQLGIHWCLFRVRPFGRSNRAPLCFRTIEEKEW
ncbi:hypothetical protein Salat_1786500 [Sesamum alatum]|uniref:Uncharacterized protein n=1 Tax=Sesamum alatum TaxID=300844 RepID=A0AAE1Y9B7_9LAMI|nr:hypothetical protein Salat_1786500 [Sesamum alatum]